MRQSIDFYKIHSSTVFVTFLDGRKAFDCINPWKLFHKLLVRNIPKYIIRLLINWYQNQEMYIRWGDSTSSGFRVSNSVKQGGILSPRLFNVYIDDRSKELIGVMLLIIGVMLMILHLLAYVQQVWKKTTGYL